MLQNQNPGFSQKTRLFVDVLRFYRFRVLLVGEVVYGKGTARVRKIDGKATGHIRERYGTIRGKLQEVYGK